MRIKFIVDTDRHFTVRPERTDFISTIREIIQPVVKAHSAYAAGYSLHDYVNQHWQRYRVLY